MSGADLVLAILERANLENAHLEKANLEFAFLNETILEAAHLDEANLNLAFYSEGKSGTKWPKGFDPRKAGCILSGSDKDFLSRGFIIW